MLKIQETLVSLDMVEKFFCCDLSSCLGQCCIDGDAGAPITIEEDKNIRKYLTQILPLLTPAGRRTIEEFGTSYTDTEGDLVTQIIDGKNCVYSIFAPGGICMCALEKASLEGKLPPLKPISCHLYPARIKEYPSFTAVNFHKWKICKCALKNGCNKSIRVFEFLREPLIRRFGENWYSELETTAHEYLKQSTLHDFSLNDNNTSAG